MPNQILSALQTNSGSNADRSSTMPNEEGIERFCCSLITIIPLVAKPITGCVLSFESIALSLSDIHRTYTSHHLQEILSAIRLSHFRKLGRARLQRSFLCSILLLGGYLVPCCSAEHILIIQDHRKLLQYKSVVPLPGHPRQNGLDRSHDSYSLGAIFRPHWVFHLSIRSQDASQLV